MPPAPGETTERRRHTRDAIDKLLAERKELLVQYYRVAGIEPPSDKNPTREALEEFCEILVDYIAAGHFGLYQRIAEGRERRRAILGTAGETYPRIAETTRLAVEFNDKYERVPDPQTSRDLARDLSQLGEHLAARVEMEDRLIAAMSGRN